MRKLFFVTLASFLALAICLMLSVSAQADEAEAMGVRPSTVTTQTPATADSRFTFDDSELNSANPNWKVIAVGVFNSKSEYEDGFRAKMNEGIRTYATLWKEKSSELRVDGRAKQSNNGRPLANIKIYYVEKRFPEGGTVIKRTTPKVTPISPNGAPPNGRQPQPQPQSRGYQR